MKYRSMGLLLVQLYAAQHCGILFFDKKANVDDFCSLFSYSDKKKLKSKSFKHCKTQKDFVERLKTKAVVYEKSFPRFFLPARAAILDSSICYAVLGLYLYLLYLWSILYFLQLVTYNKDGIEPRALIQH